MTSLLTECPLLLLCNITAMKCAFGSAMIMAPLWALIIKPLLSRFPPTSGVQVTAGLPGNSRAQSPSEASRHSWASSSASTKGRLSSAEPVTRQSPVGARQEKQYAPEPPAITNEALSALFRSPVFLHWYTENRDSLLGCVHVRCAQRVWASLAIMVVLLMAIFVLPFFTFTNEDATLWVLLQRRCASDTLTAVESGEGKFAVEVFFTMLWAKLEPLLLLVAGLTLLTSAFMMENAKNTASVMIAASITLVAEAALVERIAVGAGFTAVIGVLFWRVVRSCG